MIGYFHGILVKLEELGQKASALGADTKGRQKSVYKAFLAKEEKSRNNLKDCTKTIFGGDLGYFPGELGELANDRDDSTSEESDEGKEDSAEVEDSHTHLSELRSIGKHIYNWIQESPHCSRLPL